jgi:hypothetical protein
VKKFFLILILSGFTSSLRSMEPPTVSQDDQPIKRQDQWLQQGYDAVDDRKPDLLEQAFQHIVDEHAKYKLLFSAIQRWNDDHQLITRLSGLFIHLTDSDMRQDIRQAAEVAIGCGLDTLHAVSSPRRARRPLPRRPSSVRFDREAAVIEPVETAEENDPDSPEEEVRPIQPRALNRITHEAVAHHTPPSSMKGKIYPRPSKGP